MPVWWRSAELQLTQLARDFPPIGLALRPFLHARIASAERFRAAIPIPGVVDDDWMPGLGSFEVWGAVADGVPLCIALGEFPEPGFSVYVPVQPSPSGVLDMSLLDALALLPRAIWQAENLYFENLPFPGPGYALCARGSDFPLFRSPVRADAERLLALVEAAHPGAYVVGVCAAEPLKWLVAGPRCGRFVSLVEIRDSEVSAQGLAQRLEARKGAPFTVVEGRLDPSRL